ncbi:hypothetical protein ACFQZC_04980 [Streptacidiphilus monticola]
MRTVKTYCTAAVAGVGLLGLAACGGTAGTGTTAAKGVDKAVQSVAEAMALTTKSTQQYRSVKISLDEKIQVQGNNVNVTGDGAMSWKPLAMDMTMHSSQLAAQLGSSDIRTLMTGTTMYMGFTGAAPKGMDGKHWMKLDFSSMGAAGRAMAQQLNKASGQDPASQVKLATSSNDLKRVGTETVNGVTATHYAGTVNLAKAAAKQGLDADLKSVLDQDAKLGIDTMNVDLWVDGQNRPVKIHQSTPATAKVVMDVTIDYSDYSNTPVTVTPPAPPTRWTWRSS